MRDKLMLLLVLVLPALAQWQPDQRLTVDSARSRVPYNNAWCVAASGDTIHAAWYDDRDGNYEVYHKRSTDAGASWGDDQRLTNDVGGSAWTSLAVAGNAVHVAWTDDRDGNAETYYKRSTNGGVTWGSDTRLSTDSNNSYNPSVAASDSQVHVVWHDDRDGNAEIYYKRSTDGGFSWGSDTRLTNDSHTSQYPSVVIAGSAVRVVWRDDRDGNLEIYHKYSTDGGFSWGSDTRLTNAALDAGPPSVAVAGNVVHVVWPDWGWLSGSCSQSGEAAPVAAPVVLQPLDSNPEIYYVSSTDGGTTWGMVTRLTTDIHKSEFPSVAVGGNVVHVIWIDERDGNREVYCKRSTDGGFSWGNDTRLTSDGSESDHPSVAAVGNAVHVVWHDTRDGNYEIYYKRDPTGNVSLADEGGTLLPSSALRVAPNPIHSGTARVELGAAINTPAFLHVYNAAGRMVLRVPIQAGASSLLLNLTSLRDGIYVVTHNAASKQLSQKLIIQRNPKQ